METATLVKAETFDHLCVIAIHHFADMKYWSKQGKSDKRKVAKAKAALKRLDVLDEYEALQAYEVFVEWYGGCALPGEYAAVRDYWGAQCYSCVRRSESPRMGWYAGDECGRWMWFDSFEAIENYTKHVLGRIEQGEER